MLSYIKTSVTGADYVIDNIINDNSRDFINGLRLVDDIQLPVESILSQSLFIPTVSNFDSDRTGAHSDTIGFVAPSQSIFYTSGTIENLTGWTRIFIKFGELQTSIPTFGPPQRQYVDFGRSQPFTDNNGVYARGTFIRVPCREGMLHCEWTGDIESPFTEGRIIPENGPATSYSAGIGWSYNVGLYVDGVLVSHTGELPWGQRKPIHLDCSIPIGEKEVEIEIKWQANIDRNDLRTVDPEFTRTGDNPVMSLFNAQLFARNQYR